MNKIKVYFIAFLFALVLVGCDTPYYGGAATPNIEANINLKTMQRIQTLQFICVEHPEYKDKFPIELKQQYTAIEIRQVFKNLKWGEYND